MLVNILANNLAFPPCGGHRPLGLLEEVMECSQKSEIFPLRAHRIAIAIYI